MIRKGAVAFAAAILAGTFVLAQQTEVRAADGVIRISSTKPA